MNQEFVFPQRDESINGVLEEASLVEGCTPLSAVKEVVQANHVLFCLLFFIAVFVSFVL